MSETRDSDRSRMLNGRHSHGYGTVMLPPNHSDDEDDDERSVYTELLQGSVPCPTCRGLGNVPKGINSRSALFPRS